MKYSSCDFCKTGIARPCGHRLAYKLCTMCYDWSLPKRLRCRSTCHENALVPPPTPKSKTPVKRPKRAKKPPGEKTQRTRQVKRKVSDESVTDAPKVGKRPRKADPKVSPDGSEESVGAVPKRRRTQRPKQPKDSEIPAAE